MYIEEENIQLSMHVVEALKRAMQQFFLFFSKCFLGHTFLETSFLRCSYVIQNMCKEV
jgi:hypothetical protein